MEQDPAVHGRGRRPMRSLDGCAVARLSRRSGIVNGAWRRKACGAGSRLDNFVSARGRRRGHRPAGSLGGAQLAARDRFGVSSDALSNVTRTTVAANPPAVSRVLYDRRHGRHNPRHARLESLDCPRGRITDGEWLPQSLALQHFSPGGRARRFASAASRLPFIRISRATRSRIVQRSEPPLRFPIVTTSMLDHHRRSIPL